MSLAMQYKGQEGTAAYIAALSGMNGRHLEEKDALEKKIKEENERYEWMLYIIEEGIQLEISMELEKYDP